MSDEYLAGEIVDRVLAWTNKEHGGSSLLHQFPADLSCDERLRLAAHLRLAPLIVEDHKGDLSSSGRAVLAFLRNSLDARSIAARKLSKTLASWPLTPRKFAFAMLHAPELLQPRYFRDLDFSTSRHSARRVISRLASQGYFIGDVDPADWRGFIVPAQGVLDSQLDTVPEIHLVSVVPLALPELQETFLRAHEVDPTLSECQFYGFVGPQFTSRTFVDISFRNPIAGPDGETALVAYLRQLSEDASEDLASGRFGLNQAIELRALNAQVARRGLARPAALANLIGEYGEPWCPRSGARQPMLKFVREKLQRVGCSF